MEYMGCSLKWIRRKLLRILAPIIYRLGRIKSHTKALPINEYNELMNILETGDILVTRTKYSLTNFLIPGYYKHAIMYIGCNCVEAVIPRLREVQLSEVMKRVHKIRVMRVNDTTESQKLAASREMKKLIGKPYDVYFEPDHTAFYCSEAVWYSYNTVLNNWQFVPKERLGIATVTPNDIASADKFFTVIWEN